MWQSRTQVYYCIIFLFFSFVCIIFIVVFYFLIAAVW